MGTINTQKTYDVMGRVISTATDIGTENITYDSAGRIAKKTNSVNGTEKIYSYYPNSLVKKIITKQNGTTVYNENYGYDNAGNKTYADLNGDITEYRYDGMNRLLSVNENKTKYTEYEFDGFNNITAEYEISGSSVKKKTYYYDGNNRLVMLAGGNTATRYEYDNEGNVIQMTDGTGSSQRKSFYGYDGANRLSSFSSPDTNAEYTYNVDGLRESKTVNGEYTRFMYDGSNVAGEIKNDNYYIYYRATELMGYKSYKGDMYYYRSDSHGNVTALLDYSGKEIKNYSYSPYGRKKALRYVPNGDKTVMYMWKSETETVHNPFGYCGEYCDDETGFVYLRNRMYDPYMSRFISQDPAKDGFNWYVYCEGNPVNFVDPIGLFRIIDGSSYDKYQLGSGNINNQINDYVSDDIKNMQIKLQELGYLDKSIIWYGYFGNQTLAAVNAFKEANNIKNNTKETKGIVGATTWALMGLDFDVIESVGLTTSNVSMNRGVLRVDRNIVNANMVNTYYAAGAIKGAYKIAFGEEFNVTTNSVYWELIGHIFADEVAEINKGGMLDSFWKRVQRSTGTIDIGDNIIVPDNNRWAWDFISQLGSK